MNRGNPVGKRSPRLGPTAALLSYIKIMRREAAGVERLRLFVF